MPPKLLREGPEYILPLTRRVPGDKLVGRARPAAGCPGVEEGAMRRSDREIKDRETIDRILHAAPVCRLALCDGDRPYVIPMSYGYDGKSLYFHCASEGRKLDLVRRNPNACFEVDMDVEVAARGTACSWGLRFRSVVGFGRVTIVADPEGKRRALAALMAHYGGSLDGVGDESVRSVCVLCLDVAEVSGKAAAD